MCNFKIGQEVVYITGTHFPKYSVHIIKDIIKHSCGCSSIYVGTICSELRSIVSLFGGYSLACSEHSSPGLIMTDSKEWFKSTSFRPVQYDNISSELANKFKEVIEVCDHPVKELENA